MTFKAHLGGLALLRPERITVPDKHAHACLAPDDALHVPPIAEAQQQANLLQLGVVSVDCFGPRQVPSVSFVNADGDSGDGDLALWGSWGSPGQRLLRPGRG